MSAFIMLQRAIDIRAVIRIHGPASYKVGLCELIVKSEEDAYTIRQLFLKWPENVNYSKGFPVPAPKNYVQPHNAEVYGYSPAISAYDNLPKYTGEYGAARLRLLDFIIAELEKLT